MSYLCGRPFNLCCLVLILKAESTSHCIAVCWETYPSMQCSCHDFLIGLWSHGSLEGFPSSVSRVAEQFILVVRLKKLGLSLQAKWLCRFWLVLWWAFYIVYKLNFVFLENIFEMLPQSVFTWLFEFISMAVCVIKRFLLHYQWLR